MKLTRNHLVAAAAAIIAATNAVVLGGAAWNRSGPPESALHLSERELRPAYPRDSDNSGLALRLRWRVAGKASDNSGPARYQYGEYRDDPPWLDAAKMAELGFDTSSPDTSLDTRRSFLRQPSREVLLVLEFDGPAYQASMQGALAEAEKLRARGTPETLKLAERIVPLERERNSRIFVVDAGLDAAALRARWPDRAHYAIVRGQVEPSFLRDGKHSGRVKQLSIAAIHVPVEMRAAFEGATPDVAVEFELPSSRTPGYDAEVAFGRRLEPWLVAAARR